MKPILSLVCLLFLFNSVNGQFEFDPGYFIDNEGHRTECLIKNMLWKDNPNQFEYKLSPDSESIITNQLDIKEFGIKGRAKYVKENVIIDKYFSRVDKKSNATNFDYQEEELLLSVLEEGEATLYMYNNRNYVRYFYKVGDSPIEQLVNKSYIRTEKLKDTKLSYAKKYKLQLFKNLKSNEISINEIDKVKYSTNSLISIFKTYNLGKTGISKNYNNPRKKSLFRKKAIFGLGLSNYIALFEENREIEAFKNSLSYRLGIEIEYLPNYLNGIFSFVIEPGVYYFSDYSQSLLNRGPGKLNLYTIKLPIGLRANLFFTKKTRMFVSLFLDSELPFSSKFKYETNPYPTEVTSPIKNILFDNNALGAGLNHNNLSLEIRYQFERIKNASTFYKIRHNTIDLIFGYEF